MNGSEKQSNEEEEEEEEVEAGREGRERGGQRQEAHLREDDRVLPLRVPVQQVPRWKRRAS